MNHQELDHKGIACPVVRCSHPKQLNSHSSVLTYISKVEHAIGDLTAGFDVSRIQNMNRGFHFLNNVYICADI